LSLALIVVLHRIHHADCAIGRVMKVQARTALFEDDLIIRLDDYKLAALPYIPIILQRSIFLYFMRSRITMNIDTFPGVTEVSQQCRIAENIRC
jgi:hypothetical protein